jgi:hypothetical protein
MVPGHQATPCCNQQENKQRTFSNEFLIIEFSHVMTNFNLYFAKKHQDPKIIIRRIHNSKMPIGLQKM